MLHDLTVCFLLCDPQLVVAKSRRLRSGGKPAADKLLKPVKLNSKRGQFLKWFLDGNRGVDQAMEHFGMTRNSVLTYWAALNRDHGIGYLLTGNTIEVILPVGCKEVFK